MDKGYDRTSCVKQLRQLNATPHVAQRKVHSMVDGRTVRCQGYLITQWFENEWKTFGWMKTVGGYRKTRFRGVDRVGWGFTLAMAA